MLYVIAVQLASFVGLSPQFYRCKRRSSTKNVCGEKVYMFISLKDSWFQWDSYGYGKSTLILINYFFKWQYMCYIFNIFSSYLSFLSPNSKSTEKGGFYVAMWHQPITFLEIAYLHMRSFFCNKDDHCVMKDIVIQWDVEENCYSKQVAIICHWKAIFMFLSGCGGDIIFLWRMLVQKNEKNNYWVKAIASSSRLIALF